MRVGTEHPPSCLVPPPGDGVSAVSGFGTRGEVLSLGLGTATALQWGWQHDVQSPAPFAGGMAVGGGPRRFLTPLPYHGGFVLREIAAGKGPFCRGHTSPGCLEAPVPWPCMAGGLSLPSGGR